MRNCFRRAKAEKLPSCGRSSAPAQSPIWAKIADRGRIFDPDTFLIANTSVGLLEKDVTEFARRRPAVFGRRVGIVPVVILCVWLACSERSACASSVRSWCDRFGGNERSRSYTAQGASPIAMVTGKLFGQNIARGRLARPTYHDRSARRTAQRGRPDVCLKS